MHDLNGTTLFPLTAKPDVHDALTRLQAARKQQDTNRTWNIMIFMAGDNNLAEDMIRALKFMYSVGSQRNIRLFAYYDAGLRPAAFRIPTREERETMIERSHPGRARTARAGGSDRFLENEGFQNMMRQVESAGPPVLSAQESLERFMKSAICDTPADHYMLVLSGHGNNASGGDFLSARKRANGLTVPALKQALTNVTRFFAGSEEGQDVQPVFSKLDVLGMDSCNMSTAEVVYEIRKHAGFVVGAEGWEPNTGWPWNVVLDRLSEIAFEPEGLSPRRAAEAIVEQYTLFYSSDFAIAEVSTDQSAVNVDAAVHMAQSLKGRDSLPGLLIRALGASYETAQRASSERDLALLQFDGPELDTGIKDAILLARWESQGYKDERNVDLVDFCLNLARRCENLRNNQGHLRAGLAIPVAEACLKLVSAIEGPEHSGQDRAVILSGYCGPALQHSHGLSIFFPWSRTTDATGVSDLSQYRKMDFGADTDWARFLDVYTLSTQRECRQTGGFEHESTLNRGDWIHPKETTTAVINANGRPIKLRLLLDPEPHADSAPGQEHEAVFVLDEPMTNNFSEEELAGVRDGLVTVRDGLVTVRDGLVTVRDGLVTVRDGLVTVRDGQDQTGAANLHSPTFGRAGVGGGVRIASMKNPPVRWRNCNLVLASE